MAASIGVMPSSTFKYIFRDYDSVIYNKPVARTIANKVNTLMEKPNNHMIKVAINEEYQSGSESNCPISKK
jgi:hypothetical protein